MTKDGFNYFHYIHTSEPKYITLNRMKYKRLTSSCECYEYIKSKIKHTLYSVSTESTLAPRLAR